MLDNSHLGMRHFYRNVTFSGVMLDEYFPKRPEALRELFSELVELLDRDVIGPIQPVNKIPISQIATGLRKLQSGQNIGKIVASIGPNDAVLAECSPRLGRPTDKVMHSGATYVITGGTGGIGRSLVPWMFENGATNVVLLGRSGASHPEVARLLKLYEKTELCLRAVACDVSSRRELSLAIEAIQDLPPVRGVLHGSLYLRVSKLSRKRNLARAKK